MVAREAPEAMFSMEEFTAELSAVMPVVTWVARRFAPAGHAECRAVTQLTWVGHYFYTKNDAIWRPRDAAAGGIERSTLVWTVQVGCQPALPVREDRRHPTDAARAGPEPVLRVSRRASFQTPHSKRVTPVS